MARCSALLFVVKAHALQAPRLLELAEPTDDLPSRRAEALWLFLNPEMVPLRLPNLFLHLSCINTTPAADVSASTLFHSLLTAYAAHFQVILLLHTLSAILSTFHSLLPFLRASLLPQSPYTHLDYAFLHTILNLGNTNNNYLMAVACHY
jgi:hypothetical protein